MNIPEAPKVDVSTASNSDPSSSVKSSPKKKTPMKSADFLRFIGVTFIVALIFFSSFLTYIVFNPEQASFFRQFGINTVDIQTLLKNLINIIFGFLAFSFSIIWIFALYRYFLTKKEFQKKRAIALIFSIFFGILLFSVISLWAFLVNKVGATDFANPQGGIVVYDNSLAKLTSEKLASIGMATPELWRFDNLIGPLELRFDLRSNAMLVSKTVDIKEYEIDFDGAKCKNNTSVVTGVNPDADESIICTFDQVKNYKIKGLYRGSDVVSREPRTVDITFPNIQMIGVVAITPRKTINGGKLMKFDATSLSTLGKTNWYLEPDFTKPTFAGYVYSPEKTFRDDKLICLQIVNATKKSNTCDAIFAVTTQDESTISAKIVYEQDKDNPLLVHFHLEDFKFNPSSAIEEYRWVDQNNQIIPTCVDQTCDVLYGSFEKSKKSVRVTMTDSSKNSGEASVEFTLKEPLNIWRWIMTPLLQVYDKDNNQYLKNGSYNQELRSYYLKDVPVPITLTFDASNVNVSDPNYNVTNVEWDFDFDGKFEKIWKRVSLEVIEERRTTIGVRYTFEKNDHSDIQYIDEKIIIEGKKPVIQAILKIDSPSDYAPAIIHFDGSASETKEGVITKFLYDFWDGKGAEGDAIKDHRYLLDGQYTVTFTVIRSDGVKSSVSKNIILKKKSNQLVLNASISEGTVGKAISFDAQGSQGQILDFFWDFGDGTTATEASPSHAYEKSWTYNVNLHVTYDDSSEGSVSKTIVVKE